MATVSDALAVLDVLAAAGEADPGSLLLVLAGPAGQVALVVGIDEVPPDPPQHERVGVLAPFLRGLADQVDGIEGIALAVCRDGSTEVEGGDLAWHDAFTGAVRVAGFADHGTYLVTPRGGRPVLPRGAQAFG
ncbi:MAG TPA: hypothetical protein VK894_05455 [Jiangellales bacterium]|nr:hypothetical protein [Jiangellales bacterium]